MGGPVPLSSLSTRVSHKTGETWFLSTETTESVKSYTVENSSGPGCTLQRAQGLSVLPRHRAGELRVRVALLFFLFSQAQKKKKIP